MVPRSCTEGVIDPHSRLIVCPISGRSSDRIMTDLEIWEENGGGCRGGAEEEAGVPEDVGGEKLTYH